MFYAKKKFIDDSVWEYPKEVLKTFSLNICS